MFILFLLFLKPFLILNFIITRFRSMYTYMYVDIKYVRHQKEISFSWQKISKVRYNAKKNRKARNIGIR